MLDITPDRLRTLLRLEKQRRGLDEESLLFVGMHNLAQYWWCAKQSVLKSRAEELEFFSAYLYDRIQYARKLGHIKSLPRCDEDILKVGEGITLDEVEQLRAHERDDSGTDVEVIDMGLEPVALAEVIANSPPLLRGQLLEWARAERYPRFRWNFRWGQYVLVGVPDGITDDFVYEFKSVGRHRFLRYVWPVIRAQCDLYGYFFRRRMKRIQLYCIENDTLYTEDKPVDVDRAEQTLVSFARVDAGWEPPQPKAWKCNVCAFKGVCNVWSRSAS